MNLARPVMGAALVVLAVAAAVSLAQRPRGAASRAGGGDVVPAAVSDPVLAAKAPPVTEEEDGDGDDIPAAPIRLQVRVRSRDDEPVPGARLEARVAERVWTATADTKGAAGMAVLSGALRLRVTATGFAGQEWLLWPDAREGPQYEFDAVLEPGLPVSGRVVDAEDGAGVAGAEIAVESLREDAGPVPLVHVGATSRADGRFEVTGVPVDRKTMVRVSAAGYSPHEAQVESSRVAAWPNPLKVDLVRCGRLTGTVRDAAGVPVAGAEVRLAPPSRTEGMGLTARTDERGEYAVERLTFCLAYSATAVSESWAPPERTERVEVTKERPAARLDFRLRETGTLDVVVLDAAGEAETSGVVEVVTPSGELRRQSGPTDGDVYRFVLLEPGPTRVGARSETYLSSDTSTTVVSGTTLRVVLRIEAGVRVEGIAVDRDGEPMGGVDVEVVSLGQAREPREGVRRTVTDAGGRFVVAGLPPGEVRLHASRFTVRDRRQAEPRRLLAPASGLRVVLHGYPTAAWTVRLPSGGAYEGRAEALFFPDDREGRPVVGPILVEHHGSGAFHISGLEPGTGRLELRVSGFLPLVRTLTLRLDEHVDLGEARLDPGFRVAGVVVGPDGVGVLGARVRLGEGYRASETWTHPGGKFALGGLPAGRASVRVSADGFAASRTTVDVGPTPSPPRIVLVRGALVRGRVELPDHAPAAERVIVAHVLGADGTRGPDDENEYAQTDADGAFELRVLPGRWRLAHENESGEVLLGDVTLVDGETRPATFTLPRR
jgi:hypothetical protein